MTRAYALRKLLEHGPLTFGQAVTITGWTRAQSWSAIQALENSGVLIAVGSPKKRIYELAD